ncbi:hypothetical protein CPB86DRAFT_783300 [Serendipita vermifera]|nr:hypothetical protein CPB86DRAFT_783300 [Serendipita vermifera]
MLPSPIPTLPHLALLQLVYSLCLLHLHHLLTMHIHLSTNISISPTTILSTRHSSKPITSIRHLTTITDTKRLS